MNDADRVAAQRAAEAAHRAAATANSERQRKAAELEAFRARLHASIPLALDRWSSELDYEGIEQVTVWERRRFGRQETVQRGGRPLIRLTCANGEWDIEKTVYLLSTGDLLVDRIGNPITVDAYIAAFEGESWQHRLQPELVTTDTLSRVVTAVEHLAGDRR